MARSDDQVPADDERGDFDASLGAAGGGPRTPGGDGGYRSDPDGELGDPRVALALLEAERAHAQAALDPDPRVIFGIWGVAWLLGFMAMWLAASGSSPVRLPMAATGLFFFGCIAGAVVLTMIHIGRRVAGVRGVSSVVGAMYGWSWFLGFATLAAVMAGAHRNGLPPHTAGLLWSVLSGLVVGVLYTAGGALWQDRTQFGLGVWILLSSAAGALAGFPSVYLVMALAGGGGFLVAAGYFAVRWGFRGASRPVPG